MAAPDKNVSRWKGEAFVPGRWVEKEIRNIEIDTPYVVLIDPEKEKDGEGSYRLWVDRNGTLMLSGGVTMPDAGREFDEGDVVMGRFGVMRTFEQFTGDLRVGYVVDLRYIAPGDVPQIDISVAPDDQEEYDDWREFIDAAIPVAAVAVSKHEGLAMDPELKQKKKKKQEDSWGDDEVEHDYDVYGQPAFYPALDYLMAALDEKIILGQQRAKKLEQIKAAVAAQREATPAVDEEKSTEIGPKAKDKLASEVGAAATTLRKAED